MSKKILIIPVLICLFAFFGYFYLWSSAPKMSGKVEVPGMSKTVEVIRDNWGVPHIFASNKEDAYRALGFVVASDRLFQMEVYRRVGAGRLSEIFGEATLDFDVVMRSFRMRKYMDDYLKSKNFDKNNPIWREATAFFEGVNHFIKTQPLPYEFALLGLAPEPFSVLDAMGFIGYMAYSFSSSLKMDILFSKLSEKLRPEMLDSLRVENSGSPVFLSQKGIQSSLDRIASTFDTSLNGFSAFEGSNSWVLSGERTMSGMPILANDPHVGFSLPGIWYEAHMNTPNFEIYGHFLPGVPFPVLGHNKDYAWAFTMSEVDDMDFYREKLSEDGKKVFINGKWEKLRFERNEVKIKGKKSYVFDLPISSHGPLMDEVLKEDKGISMKWTFHHPKNDIVQAMYGMGTAKDMNDFKHSLSLATSPGLNVSYVNKEGDIGWWVFGKIPKRPNHVKNDFIFDGSNSKDEYLGYFSFDENPHMENPRSGAIITANYRPDGSSSKVHGTWEPSDRVKTIKALISKKKKWTVEDVKKLQVANLNIEISWIKAILLGAVLDNTTEENSQKYKKYYDLVSDWNGDSSVDSAAALFYHQWNRNINIAILDELDQKERDIYCGLPARWHFYKRILKKKNDAWWDVAATKELETRSDIIYSAFKQTMHQLQKEYGPLENWKWGSKHTVTYVHPIGKKKPLDKFFNLGPFPAPGGYNQINNFRAVGCKNGFQVKAGPSTRRVVHMADPDRSWGGLPMGVSGHKFSPFFKNNLQKFLAGEHRPQLLNRADIEKVQSAKLLILPRK